jgi:ABC-type Fe3+-hydroxamate transport system substrate-binding protein
VKGMKLQAYLFGLFAILFFSPPLFALRIVTLSPNLTVIVHDIIQNAQSTKVKLVGTVRYQGEPAYFEKLTNVGDASAVNIEQILLLEPDVVLAWEGGGNIRSIAQLKSLGIHVISLKADSLEGIAILVRSVGVAIDLAQSANILANKYLVDLKALKPIKHAIPESVFLQLSTAPIYTVGNQGILPEILMFCGGKNIFENLSGMSVQVSPEAVLHNNPKVILLLSSVPPSKKQYQKTIDSNWEKWSFLSAVKEGQIFQIDPNILSQNTPNILHGVKVVCEILSDA